jgi:hypothetical protein
MVGYPIASPYREILIPLEMAIVFVFLEISSYFFYRYLKNKRNKMPSVVELDWGIIFGVFGIAFISYIMGDNFFTNNRPVYLILGYMALNIGGILFFYHVESLKPQKHKFKFTLLFLIVLFIFIITYFFFPSILQLVASTASFLAYSGLIIYFLVIVKRIWAFYRLYSIGLFLGIIFWLVGYAGNTDAAITIFGGFYIRVLGDVVILIGMILVALFLNSIPSLGELGWQKKIKNVILTTKGGVGLFVENFQDRQPLDEVLVAGALTGISIFIKSVMNSNGKIHVISKGNDKFLFYEGKSVIGILLVEQDLEILKYLLKELVRQFEEFYSTILDKWTGNIELFKPTKYLVDSIFSVQKI